MANTAVLGACVRYLLPGGLQFLEQAIAGRKGRLAEANIAAARSAMHIAPGSTGWQATTPSRPCARRPRAVMPPSR